MKKRDIDNKKFSMKEWFDEKALPAMTKLASQKHLTAIRDAFGILTPVIIGGSISFLLGILLFGAGGTLETSILGLLAKACGAVDTSGGSWDVTGSWATVNEIGGKIFSTIFNFTLGTFSLMIAVMLAYIYAKKKDLDNPMFVAVFNLTVFLITAATFRENSERFNYFYDSKGMLAAIIQTFFVLELYGFFAKNKKLLIKMPKQVPPMVATGFSLLFPVALVFIIISTLNTGFWAIGKYTAWDITDAYGKTILAGGEYGFVGIFYKSISAPFSAIISGSNVGLGFGMLYQFLVGFFWFFGLNGSSVVNGAFYPFLLQMFTQNADAVSKLGYAAADSQGMLGVVNIQFLESYSQTTGWGHTGALLLSIAIFGKVKEHKEVAKIAAVPAMFSINEPVTFGIPVMLHPIYGVATMFTMPITTFFAWLFVGPIGIVKKSYIMVPWTLPPGIGALLSTGLDWKAFVLSWLCLAVVFVYFIPFVLIANKYHYNLNVKRYLDLGLTKGQAIESIKKDDEEYEEMLRLKKETKKEKMLILKEEKMKFKSLPPEERKKYQKKIKVEKREEKKLAKLRELKLATGAQKKLIVEIIEYGGFKIRVDGKTVASANDFEKMVKMVKTISKGNSIKEYTLVEVDKTSKVVKVEN